MSLRATTPTTSSGTPGGSASQVQYNGGGTFSGSSNFTFDGTNAVVAGSMTASDQIATATFTYSAAAQGAVTQLTSKSTGVTLDKSAGVITMNNATLANLATATFTLTNSLISAKDVLNVCIGGGGLGAYFVQCSSLSAGSATITIINLSGGSLSDAVKINYAIMHCA